MRRLAGRADRRVAVDVARAVRGAQSRQGAAPRRSGPRARDGEGRDRDPSVPGRAPKSVEHILALVKRSFYRGQRFHRVTASLVQFGDPQSRNMSRQDYWGTGNSGTPIGVFELSKKRRTCAAPSASRTAAIRAAPTARSTS